MRLRFVSSADLVFLEDEAAFVSAFEVRDTADGAGVLASRLVELDAEKLALRVVHRPSEAYRAEPTAHEDARADADLLVFELGAGRGRAVAAAGVQSRLNRRESGVSRVGSVDILMCENPIRNFGANLFLSRILIWTRTLCLPEASDARRVVLDFQQVRSPRRLIAVCARAPTIFLTRESSPVF